MKLDVNDYTYDLPQEKIALYPLAQRDQSRLLVYHKGAVTHEKFTNIAAFLPPDASLFFNETKVIPARLLFQKETGAEIEIFLLHPIRPSTLLLEAMQVTGSCTWKCAIGNLKRWTDNITLVKKINNLTLQASLENKQEGIVTFTWTNNVSFAEIIQRAGDTPLPPYLKRNSEELDKERYQTVYSNQEGAVAAPTAGLHFTATVFESLKQRNVAVDFLTLHVSAGTFQPIKVQDPLDHVMHQEQVVVSRENIENLLKGKNIVAVGTTSLRTLESLYWFGAKLLVNPGANFTISQQDAYTYNEPPTSTAALQAVLKYMDESEKQKIVGETSIYIVPGYTFRIVNALITNFHQPSSTLILLVAALIGDDWKKVYHEALLNDYRFLSYGDSSLLIPK
ncbi:S-adenosylmethionine:tRNA ribosyltransferase-isomerase [Chryseolinea sp. H1M3-3]|uniref:S-adenosylmethionine:tRNA ribosyltransferase-isomerase n=1 Tax=Chryseolinea sp. H1M3-3 TaxID=3034144 RepID=UPI0023EBB0D1|nr:S-adenosylmethionine:tRNA ribosyltransferase-isomerase [Chryseolinea sp. H1M3-3]